MGRQMAVLDELGAQLAHRLQRFHVVAADLAGDVA